MDAVIDPAEARRLRDRIESEREALLALCGALVAAPSAQPVGDTTAPALVLRDFLVSRGLEPAMRVRTAGKPNVVCTLSGARPGPHLVFNGHLDTLSPGDEAGWSVPVHSMARSQGRLTGLGIGNMKAGVAALALAFCLLAEAPERLAGRITFTAVADEVVFGPDGAAFLLETDPDLRGDMVINAEGPGSMDLALAEKGLLWIEITATAPAGQGMLSTRRSGAIARLAACLCALDAWNDDRFDPPPGFDMLRETAGDHGLRLSANVGRIEGGHFVSQTATAARAEVDIRIPPGCSIRALEQRLDALVGPVEGLSWRRIKGWDPNGTHPGEPVVRAVTDAALAVRGRPAKPVVRLPASDAARWRALGVPAVCFGPQPTLASGIDDYVEEADVLDCAAIYAAAALSLLGAAP